MELAEASIETTKLHRNGNRAQDYIQMIYNQTYDLIKLSKFKRTNKNISPNQMIYKNISHTHHMQF